MNRHINFVGQTATAWVAVFLLAVASGSCQAAGVVVQNDGANSIGLTNLDGPDDEPVPAAAATPLPGVVGVAKREPSADGVPTDLVLTDKPDPLTQHRIEMLEQAKPDNYIKGNPATSRRYLMVDKSTFQSRIKQ